MLWVIDLFLIAFNTSWGIHSILKEPDKGDRCNSVKTNETQYVPLLYLLSKFMIYTPSFVLGKLFLEKTPLNIGS